MEQTDETFTESNLHSEVVYDEVAVAPTGHEVVVTANEAYGAVSSSKEAASVMTTNAAYGAVSSSKEAASVMTTNAAYGAVSSSKEAASVMTTNAAYGAFSEEGNEGDDYVVNEPVYDAPRF